MRLKVLSMTGPLLEAEADSVLFPALDGSLGVMKGHAPMIAALGPGEISYGQGGEKQSFSISGGILEVCEDVLTVLVSGSPEETAIEL